MVEERLLHMGVIGLGIGAVHAERYARLAGVRLAGVCDTNRALADRLGALYGCPAYDEPLRMLEEVALDGVSICTPPRSHLALTVAAAERGIAVLTEKPMAPTVDDCARMIETCRQHGVVLMVGHKKRFVPAFLRLRELTAPNGPLGPIRQLVVRYIHGGMVRKEWFWSEDDGRGPLLENHVHVADMLGFLVGAPRRVTAEGMSCFVEGQGAQPTVTAYTARFTGREPDDGDAIVSVGYGMVGPIPWQPFCGESWFCSCANGVAEVSGTFDSPEYLRWARRAEPTAPVHEESWPAVDPFALELEHFCACIRNALEPCTDGGAGLAAVRFCLAVRDSIRRGETVIFP